MKLFQIAKDGGPKSNVTGFWIIELKQIFSIVFLKFNKGTRENYHSHAFNALTIFLKGNITEHHKDGTSIDWKGFNIKYTPKRCFHKIFAHENTYALSFRGPWINIWKEFSPKTNTFIILTHGRKIINETL